jgi:methionyl-tRNA formyltransferase
LTLRIVFMGTPEFSVPTLSEIVAAGHDVAAVYSQPPRPAGRGMAERASPVHAFAEAAGIPVFTPTSLKTAEAQATFASHGADAAVVVAYGLLLPKPILDSPREGCFNLHASALPRWRGAAPIQRAIMAGDTATAVMVMRMVQGLDTGPICLAEHVSIGADMTAGQLHDALSSVGASLMVRALAALDRGALHATPQPAEGVTYAAKIDKAESRIDFTRPAHDVHNQIRGLSPFPGAWFEIAGDGKPERIKVLRSRVGNLIEAGGSLIQAGGSQMEASATPGSFTGNGLTIACGSGAVELIEVQRAGKRAVTADEFLRGFALPPGARVASA